MKSFFSKVIRIWKNLSSLKKFLILLFILFICSLFWSVPKISNSSTTMKTSTKTIITKTITPTVTITIVSTTAPSTTILKENSLCKYSCSEPDRNCSDFSTHKEAQDFFNCCKFSKENDPMKLDGVSASKRNGKACESSP